MSTRAPHPSVRAFVACLATVAAACGSGSGGGNPTGPLGAGPASAGDFVTAAVSAECAWEARCGQIGASEVQSCVTAQAAGAAMYPSPYNPVDAVTAHRLGYDAAAAKACLDAIAAAGCTVDQQFAWQALCAKAFTPATTPGGTCLSTSECVGGYCNSGATGNDGCKGTCAAWLANAAACDPTSDTCGPADYCDPTSKKCTARAAAGVACGAAPPCAPGLQCLGWVPAQMNTPETKGTCAGPGTVGKTCEVYLFGDTSCAPGLYCDQSKMPTVCAARLTVGASCSDLASCGDGLDCIGLDFDSNGNLTRMGKCAPFLDLGGTCADPNVYETGCPYDTACDPTTKKCALAGLAGSDCTQSCAPNLYCTGAGKCAPAVALGAACTPPATMADPDPCQAGNCDSTTKVCTLQCM